VSEMSRFSSEVREGTKGPFRVWQLGTFACDTGKPVPITGVTGPGGSAKAAAWNLSNRPSPYLVRVLGSRYQMGRNNGSIRVTVPGARVHVHGYDEPLQIVLSANVESTKDIPIALGMFADKIKAVTARGVYALLADGGGDEAKSGEDEVESIQF